MAGVVESIADYFDNPTSEACYALAARGATIIPVGMAVSVERLRERWKLLGGMMWATPQSQSERLYAAGFHLLSKWLDVILACGPQGTATLLGTLRHPDADIRALAALQLCSNDLREASVLGPLAEAYRRARGTGLRIAIAVAMSTFGDTAALQSLSDPYLIPARERSDLLEMAAQSSDAAISASDYDSYMTYVAQQRGIRLVLGDIASNGVTLVATWPTWMRE